jgi:phospholipid-binding lipoprotein MlaA
MRAARLLLASLLAATCLACASTPDSEDLAEAGAPAQAEEAAAPGESDPLQPVNRGIFWANERFDRYAFEPVARGWRWVLPYTVRHRINLFFVNLRFPARFLSLLVQLKLKNGAKETGRFLTNTTVGIVGFFDPATRWGMPLHQEDFGQALGYWGTPAGPFLMLPFFGPSNPRDAVGLTVDTVLGYGAFLPTNVAVPLGVTDYVDARSLVIEDVREAREASLDFYVSVRNGYVQRRRALIRDMAPEPEEATEDLYDDLYDFEDEDEDE